jgi:hypothetical protein
VRVNSMYFEISHRVAYIYTHPHTSVNAFRHARGEKSKASNETRGWPRIKP